MIYVLAGAVRITIGDQWLKRPANGLTGRKDNSTTASVPEPLEYAMMREIPLEY